MELLILTGMSGAGKSQAVDFLEDQGFFCIDNLPPVTMAQIVSTFNKGQGGEGYGINKLAFVIDIRSKELIKGFSEALQQINKESEIKYKIIFLEAEDKVLMSRYRQTRRKHPLAKDIPLTVAIALERKMINSIRVKADYVIDTSMMALSALREELLLIIGDDSSTGMSIYIESFGFKYGIPQDSDNLIDVRFLPNPFYIPELKSLSGKDEEIGKFLEQFAETKEFQKRLKNLFEYIIPLYINEGKGRLHIGVGCTGGRHRSVYIAEWLNNFCLEKGFKSTVHHRDLDKDSQYYVSTDSSLLI